MIAEQIQKAAKWFSDALASIGLGHILGNSGSSSSSTTSKSTDININVEGSGSLGQGQFDELVEKMLERMK